MPKHLKPLTPKQEAFIQEIITNPKQSATQAAFKTYDVKTKQAAAVIAHNNLQRPAIISKLAEHAANAEDTMLEIMDYAKRYGKELNGQKEQGSSYAAIALNAAKDIQDRVHGKATQRIEQTTTSVNLNIDLTPTE